MNLKRLAIILVAGLFLYLSLYTWNLRTGHLTRLSTYTGLDSVGLVLRPGKWVGSKTGGFMERYVDLVGLKQQNEALTEEIKALRLENMTPRPFWKPSWWTGATFPARWRTPPCCAPRAWWAASTARA
mgnify:CR=1 FL=1